MEACAPPRPALPVPAAAANGFTLIELCLCLALVAVLAALAGGTWRFTRENAMAAAAHELVAHLALARSEAIARRVRVMMCASRDRHACLRPQGDHTPWQHGWLVYADLDGNGEPGPGEILRAHPGIDGFAIRSSRYRRRVTYQPLGTAGGSTITFAVCADGRPDWARYVVVANTGRPRVARTSTTAMACA